VSDAPIVTCARCARACSCVRVKDGTVYRPLAWTFPDTATPLVGLCGGCQPLDLRGVTIGDAAGGDFVYHDEREGAG